MAAARSTIDDRKIRSTTTEDFRYPVSPLNVVHDVELPASSENGISK